METRVRIRAGDVEVECAGEEAFVVEQLPPLVSDLIARLAGHAVPSVPAQAPAAPSAPASGLVSIAGVVRDYVTNAPVAEAAVTTIGLNPEMAAESDASGQFVLSGDVAAGTGSIAVTAPGGYVETAIPIQVSTGVSTQVAPVVPRGFLSLLYAAMGVAEEPDSAIVIVHLLTAGGEPLEMVAGTDIALVQNGTVVGGSPAFLGPSGVAAPNMVISQAFANQSRAVFFDVPAGRTTLALTAVGTDGLLRRAEVSFLGLASGATVLEAQLPA